MKKLSLVGIGLLVSGGLFAIALLVFTDVGFSASADDVAKTVRAAVILAIGAFSVAAAGLWVYLADRDTRHARLIRMLLGLLLFAGFVSLLVVGPQIFSVARGQYVGTRLDLVYWAAAITIAGWVLVLVTTPWRLSAPAPKSRGAFAIGVVAGVVVGVVGLLLTPGADSDVDATTATQVSIAPAPDSPTAEKWRLNSFGEILS